MSLMNDMLRDLDNRHHSLANGAVKPETKATSSFPRKTLLILGVTLLSCCVSWLFWLGNINQWFDTSENIEQISKPVLSVGGISPIAIDSREEVASPNLPQSNKTAEQVIVDSDFISADNLQGNNLESNTNNSEEDKNRNVKLLLEQGYAALRKLNLTLPVDKSASHFFRRVLEIEGANTQALIGLKEVERQYLALVDRYIVDGNIESARRLIDRAGEAQVSDSIVSHYYKKLDRAKLLNIDAPFKPGQSVRRKKEEKVSIVKTQATSERELLIQTSKDEEKGNISIAIERLSGYLAIHPDSFLIRERLFDLYLLTGKKLKADGLIVEVNKADPVIADYLSSRLKAHDGDEAEALVLLNGYKTQDFEHNKILAYRAALLRKFNRVQEAMSDYQYLVKRNPSNSTYWLGYAVTADSLALYREALNAYLSVAKLADQRANVLSYVEQRIQELSSQKVAGVEAW